MSYTDSVCCFDQRSKNVSSSPFLMKGRLFYIQNNTALPTKHTFKTQFVLTDINQGLVKAKKNQNVKTTEIIMCSKVYVLKITKYILEKIADTLQQISPSKNFV